MVGHRDMVKTVKLSADGDVAISGSVDGTLRVWDMNMRKCLDIYGDEKHKDSSFHRDSIWVIDVDPKL